MNLARQITSRRVHEDGNVLVDLRAGSLQVVDHAVDVILAEALLKGVKGKAAELGGDEVRSVLHDCLQTDVLVRALPAGNQVEHVLAVGGLALILALGTCKLHAKGLEDGLLRSTSDIKG